MSEIDMILLGLLLKEPQSAYDLQKCVEYRNISYWVKISTPSIYKNIRLLEQKKLICGSTMKNGNMPEKVIYTITPEGKEYFKESLLKISEKPLTIFLTLNSVILNLNLVDTEYQNQCLNNIETQVNLLIEHIQMSQQERSQIPMRGKMIMKQQLALAEYLKQWLSEFREQLKESEDPNNEV